ncbi:MAG: cell division protein FtsB [Betaproteobacteria bacterium]|nr:MAG: cell division protein FtsB [Betaproteobacteria bacterium]
MRILALVFALLILALQYPMWLGKGGWLQVRELDRQVEAQRQANAELKARNGHAASRRDEDSARPARTLGSQGCFTKRCRALLRATTRA